MNKLDKDDFLKNLDSKFDTFLRDTRIAIASQIRDSIKRHRITHSDAAELTGFGRTVITAVCNGRIEKISTDRLLKICTRLGLDIQVQVGRHLPQGHQYHDRIAS